MCMSHCTYFHVQKQVPDEFSIITNKTINRKEQVIIFIYIVPCFH